MDDINSLILKELRLTREAVERIEHHQAIYLTYVNSTLLLRRSRVEMVKNVLPLAILLGLSLWLWSSIIASLYKWIFT